MSSRGPHARAFSRLSRGGDLFLRIQNLRSPEELAGATIAEAVDLTMQNHLRHEFTDHDQLLMVGIRRKEARRRGPAEDRRDDSIVEEARHPYPLIAARPL
ncbi:MULTISPECIES: DUF2293 domain-containing protein [Rhizobium]|uniref:DUF2293 domain-containing protein n=1 Tax=Rhizobium TaxID=379 RepID=UPI000D14E3B6|nr:hypothetical protein C9E91_05710 [Rhizobium sp. SEMIA4064]